MWPVSLHPSQKVFKSVSDTPQDPFALPDSSTLFMLQLNYRLLYTITIEIPIKYCKGVVKDWDLCSLWVPPCFQGPGGWHWPLDSPNGAQKPLCKHISAEPLHPMENTIRSKLLVPLRVPGKCIAENEFSNEGNIAASEHLCLRNCVIFGAIMVISYMYVLWIRFFS